MHDTHPQFAYASPWKRLAALAMDVILLNLAIFILFYLIGSFVSPHVAASEEFGSRINGIGFLLSWMYFAFMESSDKQATIGKSLMGLIVTDENGDRVTFARATGRFWGRFISVMIIFIGFIMAFFTQKRQTLHDIMAGCFVLDTKPETKHAVVKNNSWDVSSSKNNDEKLFIQNDSDAKYYKIVATELSINRKDEGLWLKAFAECNADTEKTTARYIKLRVAQLAALERGPKANLKNDSGIKEKGFDFGSIKIWHVGVGLIFLVFLIATFGGNKIDDSTRPFLPPLASPITDAEIDNYNNAEQRYISPSGVHYKYDLSNPADRLRYENDPDAQFRDSVDPRVQMDHDMGYYGGGSLVD